jgi:RimJ/RimL family protein N-acetyltransferase
MSSTAQGTVIRPIEPADHDAWAVLFRGYRAFYELTPDEAVVDRVWSWITDDQHEVSGFVAVADGALIGLAHYRRFARPSTGTVGIWLDDLFVDPEARGHGAAGLLIEQLQSIAGAEGLSVVRWITASDNDRARALYDRVATATRWVVYDAVPRD